MRCESCQRFLSAVVLTVIALSFPATALAQTGGIAGTVTSGATPVAGVTVQIYNSAESFVASPATNASGAYAVSGLTPGTYYAFAIAGNVSGGYVNKLYPTTECIGGPYSGGGTYCRTNSGGQIVVAAGGTTSGIDFNLSVGGSIAGSVTAAGVGYAGSRVELHLDVGQSISFHATSAFTSATGAYQLSRLPAGNYYLRAWAGNVSGGATTGYVPELFNDVPCLGDFISIPTTGSGCSLAAAVPIVVASGGTSPVSFDLALGGAISGSVVSAGLPRSAMSASVPAAGGTSFSVSASSVTGAFLLTGLPAGLYAVTGSGGGYMSQTTVAPVAVSPGAITAGPTFDLSPGAPFIPFNYGPQSRNVLLGQSVTLSVSAIGQAPLTHQWYVGNAGDTTNPVTGATSPDYTTPPLIGSVSYWVRVTNGLNFVDSQTASIGIATAGTGAISGTITSGAQPVANATVSIYSASEQFVTTAARTSAAGAFSVAGLAPGTYFAYASFNAVTGNVTGTLVAPADFPYADVLYPNTPCAGAHSTGNYCRINTGTPISVTSGAITSGVNFDLPIGGTITGTLTLNGQVPAQLSNPWVALIVDTPGQSKDVATGHVDALGTLVLPRLPAGAYKVFAAATGMTSELWDDVPCCPSSGGTLIVVPPAGTVTGKNFDLTTAPPPPLITTQPQYQGINSGQSATLTVDAAGQGPLFYQWYLGVSGSTSSPIAGATASSYATPPLTVATNYWVRVSNYGGWVNSATVTVEVNVGGFWRSGVPGGGGGSGSGSGTVGPSAPPGGTQTDGAAVSPPGSSLTPSRRPTKRRSPVRRPLGE